jgi:hypothetical protein
MQTLGPRPVPEESDTHLPLAFPMARWLSFDLEERSRFNRAQLVLDAMEVAAPRTVGALARDTEDLALVEFEDDEGRELSVSLVATPEEHIGVRFPDGRVRWIFISRPVIEPELAREELN